LNRFEVFQLQLHVNHLLVSNRVDTAVDVNHIAVVKTPQYVQNGVGLADVTEELVAEALSFAGTFDQSSDIHNLNGGWNHILGLDQVG